MPNTKTGKKRMRQANRARDRNRAQRSRVRGAIKKVRQAETAEAAAAAYREAEVLLDRAARTHLLHRNAAARLKARLAKVVRAKQ